MQTQPNPSADVPEPATLAGLGLVAGALVKSRRRSAHSAG
jgi:PEP-CTERM motif